MRFVAIDVETANARFRSICQVGIVVFENGREIGADVLLLDPEEEFDDFNVEIHGIGPSHVQGAPNFAGIQSWLGSHMAGQIVVSHTHFDRSSVTQASAHHSLPAIQCTWLDTAKVARRAWPKYAKSGYRLSNLAREFDISFQHHDALHDARTAALVLVRAMEETGVSLDQWVDRCRLGLSGKLRGPEKREGDGDGPLLGETLVFTGTLSVPRKKAADLAHVAGGRVDAGVTKDTTMLVLGDQDLDKLAGATKSSKHRKAEQLIAGGQQIRIVAESDFMAFVADV